MKELKKFLKSKVIQQAQPYALSITLCYYSKCSQISYLVITGNNGKIHLLHVVALIKSIKFTMCILYTYFCRYVWIEYEQSEIMKKHFLLPA